MFTVRRHKHLCINIVHLNLISGTLDKKPASILPSSWEFKQSVRDEELMLFKYIWALSALHIHKSTKCYLSTDIDWLRIKETMHAHHSYPKIIYLYRIWAFNPQYRQIITLHAVNNRSIAFFILSHTHTIHSHCKCTVHIRIIYSHSVWIFDVNEKFTRLNWAIHHCSMNPFWSWWMPHAHTHTPNSISDYIYSAKNWTSFTFDGNQMWNIFCHSHSFDVKYLVKLVLLFAMVIKFWINVTLHA